MSHQLSADRSSVFRQVLFRGFDPHVLHRVGRDLRPDQLLKNIKQVLVDKRVEDRGPEPARSVLFDVLERQRKVESTARVVGPSPGRSSGSAHRTATLCILRLDFSVLVQGREPDRSSTPSYSSIIGSSTVFGSRTPLTFTNPCSWNSSYDGFRRNCHVNPPCFGFMPFNGNRFYTKSTHRFIPSPRHFKTTNDPRPQSCSHTRRGEPCGRPTNRSTIERVPSTYLTNQRNSPRASRSAASQNESLRAAKASRGYTSTLMHATSCRLRQRPRARSSAALSPRTIMISLSDTES